MNKREAYQALLDGEKIALKGSSSYVKMTPSGSIVDNNSVFITLNHSVEWEIYEERSHWENISSSGIPVVTKEKYTAEELLRVLPFRGDWHAIKDNE